MSLRWRAPGYSEKESEPGNRKNITFRKKSTNAAKNYVDFAGSV